MTCHGRDGGVVHVTGGIFPNLLVKSAFKNGPGLRKRLELIFTQTSSFFLRILAQSPVPTSEALSDALPSSAILHGHMCERGACPLTLS